MSVCSRFEVFDNQSWLFVVMDVEARLFTAHLDLDLRPRSRDKVNVRFILARCLFPKPGPGPLRKRDVLNGMIPALLILGATVCGAQVKRVIGLQILLHAESDADEPTRCPTCSWCQSTGNLCLDHPIREVKALNPDQPLSILLRLSLIHISEPTRLLSISYAVFC